MDRSDLLMDRWIDLLAASYGMPRIALLRELGTMPHLAREIARLIARQEQPPAASRTAVDMAPSAERAAIDAQTDDIFRQFANGEFDV